MEATPELRAILGRRQWIVEGSGGTSGGNGATNLPSYGPGPCQPGRPTTTTAGAEGFRSATGASSAPAGARYSLNRFIATTGPPGNAVIAPGSAVANRDNGYWGTGPCRGLINRTTSENADGLKPPPDTDKKHDVRITSLTSRNEELTKEVEKMKEKLLKAGSASWSEQRVMLLAEADELLAETDRISARNRRVMQHRVTASQVRQLPPPPVAPAAAGGSLVARTAVSADAATRNISGGGAVGVNRADEFGSASAELAELRAECQKLKQHHNNKVVRGGRSEVAELDSSSHVSLQPQETSSGDGRRGHAEVTIRQLTDQMEELRRENAKLQKEVNEKRTDSQAMTLIAENEKLKQANSFLTRESQQLRRTSQENMQLTAQLAQVQADLARATEEKLAAEVAAGAAAIAAESAAKAAAAATAAVSTERRLSADDSSESRLRAALTSQNVSVEELRQAIDSVSALVEEARHELAGKEHRERRAAFEELHHALEQAEVDRLEAALAMSRRAQLDPEDLEKAEAKLAELQSMTEEQKAQRESRQRENARKKEVFLCVKRDDAERVQELLDILHAEGTRWQDWRDYAGRSMWRCAQELRATAVQRVLAPFVAQKKDDNKRAWGNITAQASMPPALSPGTASGRRAATTLPPAATIILEAEARSARGEAKPPSPSSNSVPAPAGPPAPKASPPQAVATKLSYVSEACSQTLPVERSRSVPTQFRLYGLESEGTLPLRSREGTEAGDSPTNNASPTNKRRNISAESIEVTDADFFGEEDRQEIRACPPPEPEKPPLSAEEEKELKAQALRSVVKDDAAALGEILARVKRDTWSRWQNKAGKDLLTLSQERGSSLAYSILAKALGLVQELTKESFEEREAVWVFRHGDVQPLRATVLEDTPPEAKTIFLEYWDGDEPQQRVERCLVRKMWS
eukprot:TRINITY_DN40416_c0_g1_i1.p1 TRINITY_DN40416_c0_g1~~TRINITY_DN40416_c0_g1_i1.p1  ORF type:complete len:985 (+),score=208.34 TRINITY_DN40416_c0_g1_i1:188-2956(+)